MRKVPTVIRVVPIPEMILHKDNRLELRVNPDPKGNVCSDWSKVCPDGGKILGIGSKWRDSGQLIQKLSSTSYVADIFTFIYYPLHKDKSFLHKQYVENGFSIRQISKLAVSSKEAIRSNLVRCNIPLREKSKPHGRQPQPKYGQRKMGGKVIEHLGEQKIVLAITEMREQGLSLRKIAQFLSSVGVSTKCRGKKWHPEMVRRVLCIKTK